MSAAISISGGIGVNLPDLSSLFARNGGGNFQGSKPTVTVWPPHYFVQAFAMLDRFVF